MLNLNPSFTPLGENNLIEYKSFLFAGGEPHIKISNNLDVAAPVTITQRINSFNDLGMICITVDALRRMGVKEINLFIPYFLQQGKTG